MLNEQTRNDEKWEIYLIDYNYQGSRWSVDVLATSAQDAKDRLRAIKGNGWMEGGPVERVYIPLPASTPQFIIRMVGDILVRIVSWIKGGVERS